MSPGLSCDLEIFLPMRHCIPAECGSVTPAVFQAFIVRPEQSQPFGPAPLRTYGSPSCFLAKARAFSPLVWVFGALETGFGIGVLTTTVVAMILPAWSAFQNSALISPVRVRWRDF